MRQQREAEPPLSAPCPSTGSEGQNPPFAARLPGSRPGNPVPEARICPFTALLTKCQPSGWHNSPRERLRPRRGHLAERRAHFCRFAGGAGLRPCFPARKSAVPS